jgi:hypothetical protein
LYTPQEGGANTDLHAKLDNLRHISCYTIFMKKVSIEIFGWYGTCAIVLAYILSSFSVLSPTSLTYQIFNVTGALGIVTISLHKKAYQPAILNIIWCTIALVAIVRM